MKDRKETVVYDTKALAKEGERVTYGCLFGNIALSVLKFIAGFIGKSQAMVADAIHSASDVVATLAVLLGIKVTQKPRDNDHHFGHGKMEFIASTFVGISLTIVGIKLIITSIGSIADCNFAVPSWLAVGAAIGSIVVKETMYRITMRVGNKLNSAAIRANAMDHRSDAYSSIGTLIGITGSILGDKYGISWMKFFDPIAGFIVALLIMKVSLEILWVAYKGLMDAAPNKEILEQIERVVNEDEKVRNITYIKARYTGAKLWIDMAIALDSNLTVGQGHDVAERIKEGIFKEVGMIDHVIVHVDPYEGNKKMKSMSKVDTES